MTSKEALEELIETYINWRAYQTRECIENDYRYQKVLKDLDRLEKIEKGLKIMWYKNVNIVYIKIFKYFEKYSEYYTGYSSKDKLTREEFDLLKEVLENGL